MLDWFVILTPLLLIPVVLLLAFVGCAQALGVNDFTDTTPVFFEYGGNLPATVQSLEWRFTIDVTVDPQFGGPGIIGPPLGGIPLDWVKRIGPEINPLGESDILGSLLDLRSFGTVTCRCRVTTTDAPPVVIQIELPKDKAEDFDAPRFTFVRAGASFLFK